MAKRPEQEEKIPEQQEQQNNGSKSLPDYLEAALRIPTSYPLGALTKDRDVVCVSRGDFIGSFDPIAGICVLDYVPMLGISKEVHKKESPINRAVYQQFNAIRSQISGTRSYAPSDHMIYRMAIDSLRELYTYAWRIYGTLGTYTATNLYRPQYILEAMGLDYEDYLANGSVMYQWLCSLKTALEPFPTVPIGSLTGRHIALNTGYFTDGDAPTSQMYILNQKVFWSYEVVDAVKGLTARTLGRKFKDLRDTWNIMYSALQNSDDVYQIAADIRRAFGDKVVTDLATQPIDYVAPTAKLDAMLTSIMNAQIDNLDASKLHRLRISDSEGYIVCQPDFIYADYKNAFTGDIRRVSFVPAHLRHLNFVQSAPTAGDILQAVAFRPACSWVGGSTSNISIDSCGTEFIVGCSLFSTGVDAVAEYKYSTGMVAPVTEEFADAGTEHIESQCVRSLVKLVGTISQFDWHPPIAIVTGVDSSGSGYMDNSGAFAGMSIVEDIQNYVPITDENLTEMHEAYLLAQFGF